MFGSGLSSVEEKPPRKKIFKNNINDKVLYLYI